MLYRLQCLCSSEMSGRLRCKTCTEESRYLVRIYKFDCQSVLNRHLGVFTEARIKNHCFALPHVKSTTVFFANFVQITVSHLVAGKAASKCCNETRRQEGITRINLYRLCKNLKIIGR
jgi:hypothetical protein